MSFSSLDPIVSFPLLEPRATNDGSASSPLQDRRRFDQHLREPSRPATDDDQATEANKPAIRRSVDESRNARRGPANETNQQTGTSDSPHESLDTEAADDVSTNNAPAESSENSKPDEFANSADVAQNINASTSDDATAHSSEESEITDRPLPATERPDPSDSQAEQHTEDSESRAGTDIQSQSDKTNQALHGSEATASSAGNVPEATDGDPVASDRKPPSERQTVNGSTAIDQPDMKRKQVSESDGESAEGQQGRQGLLSQRTSLLTESMAASAAVRGVTLDQGQTESDAETNGRQRATAELPSVETVESNPSGTDGTQEGKPAPLSGRSLMQMAGKGDPSTSDRAALSGPDQARFLQRVTRAAEVALNRGGGPIRLRLSPPELGSLRLEVRVSEGVLTARIDVESEITRSALLDNVNALRDRLAEQGIRVEQFDVNLMDRQNGSAPDGPHDQREQSPNSTNRSESETPEREHEPHSEPNTLGVSGDSEQLNVVI